MLRSLWQSKRLLVMRVGFANLNLKYHEKGWVSLTCQSEASTLALWHLDEQRLHYNC